MSAESGCCSRPGTRNPGGPPDFGYIPLNNIDFGDREHPSSFRGATLSDENYVSEKLDEEYSETETLRYREAVNKDRGNARVSDARERKNGKAAKHAVCFGRQNTGAQLPAFLRADFVSGFDASQEVLLC